MSSVTDYLPGLSCNVTWNPGTRELSFDYNEKIRISRQMPLSFSTIDFTRALEIAHSWRGWKSHNSQLSFNPKDLGLASAETTVEALYLFVYSFI